MKSSLIVSLVLVILIPFWWFWQENNPENFTEKQPLLQKQSLILEQKLSQMPPSKVDTIIEKFRQNWHLAGLSLAVAYKGRLIFAKAYGKADQESQTDVQIQDMFRIASVSKLITATAIMKLVEQKKIALDSKVFGKNGILNDSIFTQAIQNEGILDIEVQHLLRHTAGWWNKFRTDPMFVPLLVAQSMGVSPPPSLETTMLFMLSQKKVFKAGTLFDYSNFGYCVLGKIIEKVSQKTYEDFVQSEILAPIGVTQMRLGRTFRQDRLPNEVCYYDYQGAKPKLSILGTGDTATRAYGGNYLDPLAAAGGWIASPVHLLRFVLAIDALDYQQDILDKKTVELMCQSADSSLHQEIGWRSCDQNKCWRSGSLAGTNALVWKEKDGFTWVFLTNTSTWRGPRFSYNIISLMENILPKMNKEENFWQTNAQESAQ